MWECSNCKAEIEDRYEFCWNCGKPREGDTDASHVRIHLKAPPHQREEEIPSENVIPQHEEIPVKKIVAKEEAPRKEETPQTEKTPHREVLPFEDVILFEDKSPSKIKQIVPAVLWLAAFILVAGFTYYSYQKTKTFDNQITEDAKNLGSQTNQFVFSEKAPREKKGTIKAKVLPLNAQNKEVDSLYYYLPDDLRPATLDEVKTLLWLDCKPNEAGKYEDGSPAFQDKCNAYLVDRTTSKVIQVQDFLGELPPLKKQWGSSYASGKVLPETYISYIKANQPENEQTPDRFASDSPNHHHWFKSELIYLSILLAFLGAVGIGWIVYKIKSARWRPE